MDNTTEILIGGREIGVIKTNGEQATIKVKKVSHLKSASIMIAYEDDLEMAKICTGLTEEQLGAYTEESFYDLVDTAHEINKTIIERVLSQRSKKLASPQYQEFLARATSLNSSLEGTAEPSS